jgi:hypothetical protein
MYEGIAFNNSIQRTDQREATISLVNKDEFACRYIPQRLRC